MEQATILHPPTPDMVSDLTTNLWVIKKKEKELHLFCFRVTW